MPQNRFFVSDISNPVLSEEEWKHIKVMRLHDGEVFELVDGKGSIALASLAGKNITIHESTKEKESAPLIIAQAFPRLNRIDIILEKGCELGMTEIILFVGDLSEKTSISDNQKRRFETILINAMKQSGRLYLPRITLAEDMESIAIGNKDKTLLFGDVSKEARPLVKYDLKEGIVFFVGPEKGFSESEEKRMRELGAKGVSLSPHILRTDTAPLAALAIISQARL